VADRSDGRCRGHSRDGAAEGITWEWQTFPSTWTRSSGATRLDIGTQVPHGAGARLCDGGARRPERGPRPARTSRAWRRS
jgi:hypothetical protein